MATGHEWSAMQAFGSSVGCAANTGLTAAVVSPREGVRNQPVWHCMAIFYSDVRKICPVVQQYLGISEV